MLPVAVPPSPRMAVVGAATGGTAAAGAGGGGGGGGNGAAAGGGPSRGVVVSWRDWLGAGAAFAAQAPSRNSCQGKQRSWSDWARPDSGASNTPQIEIPIRV